MCVFFIGVKLIRAEGFNLWLYTTELRPDQLRFLLMWKTQTSALTTICVILYYFFIDFLYYLNLKHYHTCDIHLDVNAKFNT